MCCLELRIKAGSSAEQKLLSLRKEEGASRAKISPKPNKLSPVSVHGGDSHKIHLFCSEERKRGGKQGVLTLDFSAC